MKELYIIVHEDESFDSAWFEENEAPEGAIKKHYKGNFIKPKYNGDFYEGATPEELEAIAVSIDFKYTLELIPRVLTKHVQKKTYVPNYQTPQDVIEEVDRLRAECNEKITTQTGITDFSYRQNYPELM